jgi:pilus assembly protein CpaC
LVLTPSKQEIVFRGVRAGKTSVTIRDLSGDIRHKFIITITADGNSNTVKELRELIGGVEGIEINIRGGKVIVEGELVVPNELGRIMTILGRYQDVLILIEYSKQTQILVAREMQDAINKSAMKDVTVRVVNSDYWLEGVVNSAGKKTLAETIANAYTPDKIKSLGQAQGGERFQGRKDKGGVRNFINVNEKKDPEPPPKLVKISAQFVELSKDYSKVFSFKWQPFMSNDAQISFGRSGDGGVSTSENGTLSGTIAQLFPKLQSAKSAGYARVIQSGMVVTNDGKAVSLKKSTPVDFAVGSGENSIAKSSNITFSMNTTPKIGVQESVFLEGLVIEVSLPSGTDSGGNPKTTNNTVSTNLTVKSKESAVIGGVIQSSSITDYDKDPTSTTQSSGAEDGSSTAQTSTLFNLFRGKAYATNKSQFVVFVTPEILESASKGTEAIRKKFRKRER